MKDTFTKILIGFLIVVAVGCFIYATVQTLQSNHYRSEYTKKKSELDSLDNLRKTGLAYIIIKKGEIDSVYADGRTIKHHIPVESGVTIKPPRRDTITVTKTRFVSVWKVFKDGKWVTVTNPGDTIGVPPERVRKETEYDTTIVVETPMQVYYKKGGFKLVPQLIGGVSFAEEMEPDVGLRIQYIYWNRINVGTEVTYRGFTPLDIGIRLPLFNNVHLVGAANKDWKNLGKLKEGWTAKGMAAVDLW